MNFPKKKEKHLAVAARQFSMQHTVYYFGHTQRFHFCTDYNNPLNYEYAFIPLVFFF